MTSRVSWLVCGLVLRAPAPTGTKKVKSE